MKIKEITREYILFDNEKRITYHHDRDCCEQNYADFQQIEDNIYIDDEFEEESLCFEEVNPYGFRFGNEGKMIFVPCYSIQNDWYSNDLDIYYDDKEVLNIMCKKELY